MATKEQLTYTDVRNAAAQADALEAVDNYMQVQQRRRTGYTTKADPTEKWHTGHTFTDYDGKTYQLRIQYNADGSIRNQQKVEIGQGKIPKATDEKPPLSYEQVGMKYNIFKEKEGADSAEVQDLGRRYIDIGNVEDINLQLNMLEEFDKDLNIASSFDKPSTAEPDVTYANIQNRFDAIKGAAPADWVKWGTRRLMDIKSLEEIDPVAYKLEIKAFNADLNQRDYDKPSAEGLGNLTIKGVRDYVNSLPEGPSKVKLLTRVKNAEGYPQKSQDKALTAIFSNVNDLLKETAPTATTKFTAEGVQQAINTVTDPDEKAKLQISYAKASKMKAGKSQQTIYSRIVGNVGDLEKVEDADKGKEILQKFRTISSEMHHQARFQKAKADDDKLPEAERQQAKEFSLQYYMRDVETKILRDSHLDKIEYKGQVVMAGRPESINEMKLQNSKLLSDWQATDAGIKYLKKLNEFGEKIKIGEAGGADKIKSANAILRQELQQGIYDYAQRIQPYNPQKYYYDLYIVNEPDESYWEYGSADALSLSQELARLREGR